jgi:hypothetical protein
LRFALRSSRDPVTSLDVAAIRRNGFWVQDAGFADEG